MLRSKIIYYYLLLAMPAIHIINFFLSKIFNYKVPFGVAHIVFLGMIIFFIQLSSIKQKLIMLIYITYPLIYSINSSIFDKSLRETTLFIGLPAMFFFLDKQQLRVNLKEAQKSINIFSIVFVVLYVISVFYSKILIVNTPSDELIVDSRIYYNGFIISHSFGYYTSLITLYFLITKRSFLSIIFFSLTILQGARAPILGLFVLLIASQKILIFIKKKHISVKSISLLLLLIIVVTILYYNIPTINYNINSIYLALITRDENSLLNLSTGRTALIKLGFFEIIDNFSFFELIFGRGALASGEFTQIYKNYYSWFHCDQLQILFNFGILGLIIYTFPIIKFMINRRWYAITLFIFTTGFVNGFYLYDYLTLITIYYVIEKIKLIKNKNE